MPIRTINFANVSSSIFPSANVTYDLGNTSNSWRDLYLSGNTVNIGGASISVDSGTGSVVLVPAVSNSNPNPKATIISANGVSTVDTTAGVANTSQVSSAGNNVVKNKINKTYNYRGALEINTSTVRYYIDNDATLTTINSYVGTNGTSNVVAAIKVNDSQVQTVTIVSSTGSNLQSGLTTSLTAGDYFTIDITAAGGASDLYINLIYEE